MINNNCHKKNSMLEYMNMSIEILLSIVSWVFIIVLDNSQSSMKPLGILIIIVSLYQLYKVRLDTNLLLLFGIIAYVNISISLADILQIFQVLGPETLIWQNPVRLSEYNIITAKCVLLSISVLNSLINTSYLKNIKCISNKEMKKIKNNTIYFLGFLVLIIFWIFGYQEKMGSTYGSNTRTIYEYCILIFIVVWLYSGESRIKKNLLLIYAGFYISQSLVRGDRSSAFPLIIAIFLLKNFRLTLTRLLLLVMVGISTANFIHAYRISYSISNMLTTYLSTYNFGSFLSDTASQSYYTAISIVNVGSMLPNSSSYFFDFLGGIFMGGGFRNADVGAVSNQYLLNKGGGMYFSWFYFWFGFIGVAFAVVILGVFIRKAFKSESIYKKGLSIAITSMSLRWYVYTPFVLFRSIGFVFIALMTLCYIFERKTRFLKKKKIDLYEIKVENLK